ncbi:MAG: Holliday junction resolvase RuvX [Planctomycetes bacterium]|nr:Holliday junction resolvase RuvX [Planctomycetota bacterium]
MTRWLAVDHGTKRIGLAVSDETGSIVSPMGAIPATPAALAFSRIADLADEYDISGVVVGWPLNVNDTEGPQGRLARAFACELAEAVEFDVRLWDERLSSLAADEKLAGHYTPKQAKSRRDAVAAATILADFLAADGPNTAPTPQQAKPPKVT